MFERQLNEVVGDALLDGRKASEEPLGISTLYPPRARELLVKAAEAARMHPIESVTRKRIIDEAIETVRRGWPELFRN